MRLVTLEELDCLRRYAGLSQATVVEIGVLDGETSAVLASETAHPVVGIDPLIGDSMDTRYMGSELAIARNTRFRKNFKFVRAFSYEVAPDWREPLGMVFIDGDHSFDGVNRDLQDWRKHVLPGGFLIFHDSCRNRGGPPYWPGPSMLTDRIIAGEIGGLRHLEDCVSLSVFQLIDSRIGLLTPTPGA